MNNFFAERSVNSNNRVTVKYSFGEISARCLADGDFDDFRLSESYDNAGNPNKRCGIYLDKSYLSECARWQLISGIESAAKYALTRYQDYFRQSVKNLDLYLNHKEGED